MWADWPPPLTSPPLPSDVLFAHQICHLWDGEGHDGQQKPGAHALLPEGLAGSLWRCENTHTHTHTNCVKQPQTFSLSTNRVHWRFCWNASRHGERQVRWSASSHSCRVSCDQLQKIKKKTHGTFLSLECRMTWSCPQNWGESESLSWNIIYINALLKQKGNIPFFVSLLFSYKHAIDGLYRVFREGKYTGVILGWCLIWPLTSAVSLRGREKTVLRSNHGVQQRSSGHCGAGTFSHRGLSNQPGP